MAIAVTRPVPKVGFIANATSADASACEEIMAAVAGKSIKVRHLTVNTTDALTITIGEGETGGAVTTALIGPIAMAANSSIQWSFNPPMELTAATSLTVDASGAGAICIFVQGVIE
jgi:acetyl-CoA carboxylase alpha subunit